MFGDGLEELQKHFTVRQAASLIAKTARWVDPATFRLLPVWFPEYARGAPLHNRNYAERRKITKKDSGEVFEKKEGNTQANIALCKALGTRASERPNWTCCHIWGVDDPTFAKRNEVVKDHRFFTCVANMVLLPTPLKAFTDTTPQIKGMLRRVSTELYGWSCDHPALSDGAGVDFEDADFPVEWRDRDTIPGIVPIAEKIRKDAAKRKATIKHDLEHAGEFYPRQQVRAALDYWNITL